MEAGHAEEALGHLRSRPATIHLLFLLLPPRVYVAKVWPHIALLVTSGEPPGEQLPPGSIFLRKPYEPLHALEHARALTG